MKTLFWVPLLLVFNGLVCISNGQVSKGGTPLSFLSNFEIESESRMILTPIQNKAAQLQFNQGDLVNKMSPFVFATPIWTSYSPLTHGKWVQSADGKSIWILSIKSNQAYSLNLLFRKFKLPPSGRLFIYNADKSFVLGAFTDENNKPDSLFATSPIPGDELIIEYSQDSNESVASPFEISQVNHDFLDVFSFLKSNKIGSFGSSDYCNVDVGDDSNSSTLIQEQSVCKIIINGSELCSGTMLANTSSDSSVYFLTAAHCLSTQEQASNTLFYYNYQSPNGFGLVQGSIDFQTLGATLVSTSLDGDFTLLKLQGERPSVAYRPYLAGWNRSTSPPAPYFAIHHPSGDVKKISRASNSVIATTFYSPPFATDFHWQVPVWNSGTTEGGSSGCGLFDANGLLIGNLSGGDAFCGSSVNDYFARFNRAWDAMPTESEQLAHWLDLGNKTAANQFFIGKYLYASKNAQRISNVVYTDSTIFRENGSALSLGLFNLSPISKIAEKHQFSTNQKIEGVYVVVGKGSSSATGSVKISFWEGGSIPETEIYSFNTPLSYFISNREKYIKVNSDLIVSNNVFVSVELLSPAANDTLGIYVSEIKKDNSSRPNNTLYVHDGNQWSAYSEFDSSLSNGSSWVDLVVSDALNNSVINKKANESLFKIYPNPVKDALTIKSEDQLSQIFKIHLVAVDGICYDLPFVFLSDQEVIANTSTVKSGVYVLKIQTTNGFVAKKIVIDND